MDDADIFDLAIIGGGINGVGIARDAAGRGLRVVLCDKGDLGGATSSATSKLIHGGLRYLEYGDFGLVRHALRERKVLLRTAPHLVRPMRFVLPHVRGMRPAWLIRIGLFLYDHLGGRRILPASESLDLTTAEEGKALRADYRRGFAYSDCWVDDSRLVISTAMDARERGATILPNVACTKARVVDNVWYVTLSGPPQRVIRARALVNAAGPWADDVSARVVAGARQPHLTLVQGSHIVLPRLFEGDHAYILQNTDGRVVFAIPYEQTFTMIGTTDTPFEGDPGRARITDDEIDYLLRVARTYFRKDADRNTVVWSFAGVRPLYDDGNVKASAVTRDYVFDLDLAQGAPALTIFGGKLTTFRRLAEHALQKLGPHLRMRGAPWTADAVLPGGNLEDGGIAGLLATIREDFRFLSEELSLRYARAYGVRVYRFLHQARTIEDLGSELAPGLYSREVDYLCDYEWARSAEDILWRRTKLGLTADAKSEARLKAYLRSRPHH